MDSEQNRSDEYWMGVRDALRMVDSFYKWSKVNEDRAKPLEEFLSNGLVAAAKRCESCLHKQLGIEFTSEEEMEFPLETPSFDSEPPSIEESSEPSIENEDSGSFPPEIVLEPEGSDEAAEIPVEVEPEFVSSDDSLSIESIGASEGSLDEDSIVHGEPRDFSDDFILVEPDPLVVAPETDGIETPQDGTKDAIPSMEDITIDEQDDADETSEAPPVSSEEELTVERPRNTWDTSSEDPLEEPKAPPPAPEMPSPEDSIEPPKVWSPMDDPSPETLIEEESAEEGEDSTETPPAPPPPESEESEEERRRRARRLFFGA